MNKHLISDALTDIDEQFIAEARAESVKPAKHFQIKYIISAAACACAIMLCVCLPIALSHSGTPAVPPQTDTGTPPNTDTEIPSEGTTPPDTDTDTPPSDTTPPQDGETSSGVTPPVDSQKPYIESGYVNDGNSDPSSPFMIAYKINREFDEQAENLSVQLSFGVFMFDSVADLGITKVVVSVWNSDSKQDYVLKEFTAEEFFVSEYDVEIKYTIGENEEGELVTVSETRTFKNEQTFSFPSSMCNKSKGTLTFNITAYDGDEYVIGGGDQVYYLKSNGKINFLSYQEYRELELSDQTPPKTDIIISQA